MAKVEKENKKESVKKVQKNKAKKAPKNKSESALNGISKELKLVKWPSLKEIVKYTIATIIFCIILVAFFELLTFVVAAIREWAN